MDSLIHLLIMSFTLLYMIDTSIFHNKKAKFFTLGCKLNFSETSTFAKMLTEMGVVEAKKGEKADLCLINTCSVTETANHKCRQAIHRLVRENEGAFVVVTGCYAQLETDEVADIDGVSLVLGSNEKSQLIQFLSDAWQERLSGDPPSLCKHSVKTKYIRTFAPSCSRGNRTRYFLKVQDGCDYFCTYCTIPLARGFSRNAPIDSLVSQAEQVAQEGGSEIVLTGVNIGDFGRTTGETFLDLIKRLDGVNGIERYRISSIEPNLLTDDIIAFCASSRAFMPHFHIPLQSGSDSILKLMHRRYDTALFAHKIHLIKQYMPDAFIGVDVMVGTRGETPELFDETYSFLEGLDVSQLHVFPYSERPGTAALKIPYIVDQREKRRRANMLLELSDKKTHAFYERHIGKKAKVLFEKAPRGKAMHGFTENYIRVELPAAESRDEYDNKILTVSMGDFNFDQSALMSDVTDTF